MKIMMFNSAGCLLASWDVTPAKLRAKLHAIVNEVEWMDGDILKIEDTSCD